MKDPDFDKGTGPVVTTESVYAVCITIAFCVFLGFACYQPETAVKIGAGMAAVVCFTVFFYCVVNSS